MKVLILENTGNIANELVNIFFSLDDNEEIFNGITSDSNCVVITNNISNISKKTKKTKKTKKNKMLYEEQKLQQKIYSKNNNYSMKNRK